MGGTEVRVEQGIDGDPAPPDEGDRAIGELRVLLGDQAFEEEYIKVQTAARRLEQDFAKGEVEKLRAELDKYDTNPELKTKLIAALDVWGRTRNASGQEGEDRQGFHAGVVHYFEYRASESKTKRYLGGEHKRPSIEDFIKFSEGLKKLIDNPDPLQNPLVTHAARIGDEMGQSRLRVLTQDHFLVVGFQKAGDRTRVLTAVSNISGSKFQEYVDTELNMKSYQDTRFNKLGNGREEVPLVR
jgi:hypothetical protein